MNLQRNAGHDPWSIRPGVVREFVASTETAGDHLYWGLLDGPGIRLMANSTRGPQAGKPTSLTGDKLLWYRNL